MTLNSTGIRFDMRIAALFLGLICLFCLLYVASYVQDWNVFLNNPVLISGGLAGGVLHALTGPDHLLSVLPHILGQHFWKGFRIGSVWGIGHGLTTCFIGGIAYVVKGSLVEVDFLDFLLNANSFAVGLTLIVIGLMGLQEAGQYHSSHMKHEDSNENRKSDVVYFVIFLNGLFLGFSWDGLPSLAPTLTTTSLETLCAFLGGNFFGTMLSISLFSGIIAEGSSFLSRMSNEALVSRMCALSSVTAALVGSLTVIAAVYRNSYYSLPVKVALIVFLLFLVTATVKYIGFTTGGYDYLRLASWGCLNCSHPASRDPLKTTFDIGSNSTSRSITASYHSV